MITSKDKNWIRCCEKLLKYSTHKRYLMAAVLVKGGKFLASGNNKELAAPKPYTTKKHEKMALHAEVDLLHGLSKKVTNGSTLYIYGETKAYNLLCSKPCASCMGLILVMGIRRIVCNNGDKELEDITIGHS